MSKPYYFCLDFFMCMIFFIGHEATMSEIFYDRLFLRCLRDRLLVCSMGTPEIKLSQEGYVDF